MSYGRMYAPSPTVASSRVPFYLRGVSPGVFSPEDPHAAALVASGIDPDTADLIFGAVSSGQITRGDFEKIVDGEMSHDEVQKLLFGVTGNQVPRGGEAFLPLMEIALGGLGDDEWSVSPDGTMAVDQITGQIVDLVGGNVYDSSGELIASGSGALDSSYQALLNSQVPDTNPLDYVSPQAAIAAGIPAAQVNAAWSPAAQARAAVLQSGGTQAQANAAAASLSPASTASQVAAAVANALKLAANATTIGPSPRISTTIPTTSSSLTQALTQSSIVRGVPDIAIIGGGFLAVMMLAGKR